MIAPFSTHWPKTMPAHLAGKPTQFVEKITNSLSRTLGSELNEYLNVGVDYLNYSRTDEFVNSVVYVKAKLHTIRADEKERWKPGRDIHFVINNRSKNQYQFAPVIKCVSVQTIEIKEMDMTVYDCIKLKDGRVFTVRVDGKYLPMYRITELAKNDGFDSVEDFFAWFNTDFHGKLIHWTNLKY